MTINRTDPQFLDLSLNFMDRIGTLRRWATHTSRPSDATAIQRELDKLVRWQAELRKEVCRSLGLEGTSYGWGTLVNHIANEHERAETVRTEEENNQ